MGMGLGGRPAGIEPGERGAVFTDISHKRGLWPIVCET